MHAVVKCHIPFTFCRVRSITFTIRFMVCAKQGECSQLCTAKVPSGALSVTQALADETLPAWDHRGGGWVSGSYHVLSVPQTSHLHKAKVWKGADWKGQCPYRTPISGVCKTRRMPPIGLVCCQGHISSIVTEAQVDKTQPDAHAHIRSISMPKTALWSFWCVFN